MRTLLAYCALVSLLSVRAQDPGTEEGALKNAQHLEIRGMVVEAGTDNGLPETEVRWFRMAETVGVALEQMGMTKTDSHGRFSLQPHEAGVYALAVQKEGYSPAEGRPGRVPATSSAVVAVDKDRPTREVNFSLGRPGEITGVIMDDETGQPLKKFRVWICQRYYYNGRLMEHNTNRDTFTDANGRFRFVGLRPSEYLVLISPAHRVLTTVSDNDPDAVDSEYERSYWPGGHDLSSAAPVHVASGGSVDMGTLRLRRTPAYRVRISTSTDECRPGEKVEITEITKIKDTAPESLDEAPCGKAFQLAGIQPGSYIATVSISGRSPENAVQGAVEFQVTDRNLEIKVPLERGADVNGRILAEEGVGPLPLTGVTVVTKAIVTGQEAATHAGAQGTFWLAGVPVGAYRVSIRGLDPTFYTKNIRVNGIALADNVVSLAGPASMEIVVDDKAGTISGTVSDSNDHPVNQPYVLLVRSPTNAADIFESVTRTTGDSDGRFHFTGLVPADYRLLAVSLESADQLDKPYVLEGLLGSAAKVSLDPRGYRNISLKLTQPVQ